MQARWLILASVPVLLLAGVAIAFANLAANDDDGKEQNVSLKQLPDSVKATVLIEILREVDGLEIEEVKREVEDGKTVYEVEFEFRDKEVELEIDSTGKLLEKEVELDDEDGENDKDNEAEEDEDEK